MHALLPEPKEMNIKLDRKTVDFDVFELDDSAVASVICDSREILTLKLWNYQDIHIRKGGYKLVLGAELEPIEDDSHKKLYETQGYTIRIDQESAHIDFKCREGLVHAFSTLKQLLVKTNKKYHLHCGLIKDWPSIERRSISNTFAWYAGYGRYGFDMQLWGFDEWVEYLNICSDFKINQFNMCMYGYWPFKNPSYPETELKGCRMRVWNPESNNWITVEYIHPNLVEEFLPRLIEYGHRLCVQFFAYVGLNSYNGGRASIYKDKRMVLPPNSKYVNDFDRLCLSKEDNIDYLKESFKQIVKLGYDGIDFEESEEAFWYCNCEECKVNYLDKTQTPEEASHMANHRLLETLYKVIREENPNCVIGVRAWRQPPLIKPPEGMRLMTGGVPEDVVLFWAPGLYVPESEFEKWVSAFGRDRIYARDTESNAISSCFGRLIRIFRSNGLRCEEETNDQFLEEDIRQHIGSAKLGVKGINGYMFEWYGFFLHLFAHAYYGWGGDLSADEFCDFAVEAVFAKELKDDILFVLKNMLVIHESQIKIFPTEFPFARNKVEERDLQRIKKAIQDWPEIMNRLRRVKAAVMADERLSVYAPHFEKLMVSNERNRVIYDLAIASVYYEAAKTTEEKRNYLLEMYELNEKDFDIVRRNYFDVNPVSETGTKSCMIPCHELKRVLTNELDPEKFDAQPIYLGVEALGWLWL